MSYGNKTKIKNMEIDMDIVERLRKPVDDIFFGEVVEPIKWEAADEIERLREAVLEIVYQIGQGNNMAAMDIAAPIAEAYLQQKDTE